MRIDKYRLHSFASEQYTTAFCLSVGNNLMTPQQFVKIFVKNPKSKNDEIVTHFIKEIENKC